MLAMTEPITKDSPCVKRLNMQELCFWLEKRKAYLSEHAPYWNNLAAGVYHDTGTLNYLQSDPVWRPKEHGRIVVVYKSLEPIGLSSNQLSRR